MRKQFICLCFALWGIQTTVEAQKVKFGVLSDVHVPTMHDAKERLTAFVDSMKTAKPDFVVDLGDFGTPAPKYAYGFEIWNSFPGPKYHVIGCLLYTSRCV